MVAIEKTALLKHGIVGRVGSFHFALFRFEVYSVGLSKENLDICKQEILTDIEVQKLAESNNRGAHERLSNGQLEIRRIREAIVKKNPKEV